MSKEVKQHVVLNLIWRFAERCGAQGVNFFVSIILARLLAPEDYGLIALVTVFTTVLNVFVDSGMANALIQKKDADDVDFSSVFYFNFVVCVLLYGVMYIASPWIATFYHKPELVGIVRVLSLTLVISGIKNVQQAYVSRNMLFKKFFYSTLGGTIFSAIVGIVLAYKGYGVWALVAQQLSNLCLDTAILWVNVKWRPKLVFSRTRLKGLLSFGWKLLVSALLDSVYNNLRQLVIGKMYTSSDLAFYNKGKQFPNMIMTNINSSIDSILLPTMSKVQDSQKQVKNMTRRAIKTSTYIMAPLMMGLAFTASSVVQLILTDKWMACVPYMRIFCVSFMFYPLHTANLNAIKAMGRSDLFLKMEIVKKLIGITLLFLTMRQGVMVMAYSLLISSFLSQIINSWPNKRLLNYGYLEQLKDILPSIVLAVIMGVSILLIETLEFTTVLMLAVQIIVGMIIYVGISVVLKYEPFLYLWSVIKSFTKKASCIL